MGKAKEQRMQRRRAALLGQEPCNDVASPICECCTLFNGESEDDYPTIRRSQQQPDDIDDSTEDDLKELVVIGAGTHAMALVLRLLQPDADFMSEKERHIKAEHHSVKIRPLPEVNRYVQNLGRGVASTLKMKKPKAGCYSDKNPPPIDLRKLRKSVLVVDKLPPPSNGESAWMSNWNKNFEAIEIPHLRSLTSAHLDPYDHRSLDVYAERNGRRGELISLDLLKQRDKLFHGPYQAPSTSLFKDFHAVLGRAYGIDDMVQNSAEVESVVPKSGLERTDREPYFELRVKRVVTSTEEKENDGETVTVVKAKRVVYALGPMFRKCSEFWEQTLPASCRHQILHFHEIVPWLIAQKQQTKDPTASEEEDRPKSLLLVGGGITSFHLAILAAKAPWCKSVTLIQRARTKERQFDIDNKWMGPFRGKFLDEFWSEGPLAKATYLKEARPGGSVPPELVKQLLGIAKTSGGRVQVKQEVQISEVAWAGDKFRVQLDDGSSEMIFDMIWSATGADNDVELYPSFQDLMKDLPIDVVGGLPVLDPDLSWKRPSSMGKDSEAPWKGILRRRLHVMGCLAGLQ
eukprot:CAMPEP_0113467560 /NCGR_PEP_ID=MMETSP0014_2-20120614/14878_1 /TAXON_ID=2857 /ORGANISM="Nitzschia sp." /LENGTH=573 /DNA_ID=CAMNT_0000359873 /DNA_START=153 /DNA_END=1871 /DNA_ORIENTATION=+ /assembly_acc=CAM_ASM_000159